MAYPLKDLQALRGGHPEESRNSHSLHQTQTKFSPESPRALGKAYDQLESQLRIRAALRICAAILSLATCQDQVLDGLGDVVARAIVVGKIDVMVFQPVAVEQFDRLGGALMQRFASIAKERVVSRLTGQRVLEDVLDITSRRLLVDKLAGLQGAE